MAAAGARHTSAGRPAFERRLAVGFELFRARQKQ
jgi:hypothetical protein